VKEVEETWRLLKFNVQQYTKGTSDRGHILGTIDEVMQTLDDNAMQLQGILSSRFIGPFLNSVQNWEKALSHISEVLEVQTVFVTCQRSSADSCFCVNTEYVSIVIRPYVSHDVRPQLL